MDNNFNDNSVKKNKSNLLIFTLALLLLIVAILLLISMSGRDKERALNGQAEINLDKGNYENIELENDADAVVVIPGANPVSKTGAVLTEKGEISRNDGDVMGEQAPRQTSFLSREDLPPETLFIEVASGLFSPKSFSTTAGSPTFFALTSRDDSVHTVTFDDSSLSAIAVSVGPEQTRGILFNAPPEAGSYSFRCITPGHAEEGEVGEMIVQ